MPQTVVAVKGNIRRKQLSTSNGSGSCPIIAVPLWGNFCSTICIKFPGNIPPVLQSISTDCTFLKYLGAFYLPAGTLRKLL
jgi:hypothetical protein